MTPRRANRLARWAYYTKISAKAGKTPSAFFDQSRPIASHGNKTVLVLDGQAEANGAAKLFVFREDEVRVRQRGETRMGEAEP